MPQDLNFLSDPTLLAGVAGTLFGALITGLLGWRALRIEQADAYKREFQAAITSLVDLNEDYTLRVQKIVNLQEQAIISAYANSKKIYILKLLTFWLQSLDLVSRRGSISFLLNNIHQILTSTLQRTLTRQRSSRLSQGN